MSIVFDIAHAIKQQLETGLSEGVFSMDFVPEVNVNVPQDFKRLTDNAYATTIPITQKWDRTTRGTLQLTHVFHIGLQLKKQDDDSYVKAEAVVEEIIKYLMDTPLSEMGGKAKLMSATNHLIYSHEKIRALETFTGVASLEYIVYLNG